MHCVSTIRRLRCATPPVIHNATASAAILLTQNNLLSQNKNSTEILQNSFLITESFVQIVLFVPIIPNVSKFEREFSLRAP
jgi:hypothetical protein